jgi:hypothetical protein
MCKSTPAAPSTRRQNDPEQHVRCPRHRHTINLNGNALAANTIYLGYFDRQPVTLNRGGAGGTLTATNLEVGNNTFNLLSTDSVTNYYLHNATSTLNSSVSFLHLENGSNATTSAAGNVTGGVEVFSGSTLNLGGNLNLSGNLDIRDLGSTVNAHGFGITANTLYVLDTSTTRP